MMAPQRILARKGMRFRLAVPLLFAGLWLAGCQVAIHTYSAPSPSLELTLAQTEPNVAGSWSATLGRGSQAKADNVWLQITVRDDRNHTMQSLGRTAKDFPALMADDTNPWPGQFEYATEGGTFRFRGERSGAKAAGQFSFSPNPDYVARVTPHLRAAPSGSDWLWLTLQDVQAEEIEAFARSGARLDAAEVCRLKAHGVKPEYLAAVREGQDFSIDEVIRLRTYGVPSDGPAKLRQAGYQFGADSLVRLRTYGVTVEEAAAWKEAGFALDANELVRLRTYGVRPAFGKAVRAVLSQPTVDELVRLRTYGVSEQFLAEMGQADSRFTAEDLVHLRTYGVPADYVVAWRKAGFDFSARELTRLRTYGVPASYAAALSVPNRKPLSAEMIIKLRQRGLSPEEVRQLRE